MQIHTFRAESLQAALQQVRRQLGPDAAILQTREKRQGRLGLFAKPIIEVEATLDSANSDQVEYESHSAQPAIAQQSINTQPINTQPAGRLKVSGAIELSTNKPHVVALVGPTGCGKTTSLAKIAACFRFELGVQVGLIALDSFRFGAVDQLLQYADMLSASLEVVSSAEQVPAALQRLQMCDLVLIDTAGRAPRDTVHLDELHKFLQLARPQSIQLVISATSSTAHATQTVDCFSLLKPTDLLITKLDEAVDFGSWSKLLERSALPISYLTHGQRVPQDITPATADRLASLLIDQQLDSQQQIFQHHASQSVDFPRQQGQLPVSS